jgi:ArsR family transcriptional regulator
MLQTPKPDFSRHEREAEFLQALAHPVRLKILELVSSGEICGCEIEPRFDLDQSTISRHLQILRRAGILLARKDGVRVLYRVRSPRFLRLYRNLARLITEQAQEELAQLAVRSA